MADRQSEWVLEGGTGSRLITRRYCTILRVHATDKEGIVVVFQNRNMHASRVKTH